MSGFGILPRPLQGERAGERGAERSEASVVAPTVYSPLSLTLLRTVCPSPPEGGEGFIGAAI
jgi:hypothetical protein